jgi:hypothetical protein
MGTSSMRTELQREGKYWIPGDVKLSDRHAAQWLEFMTGEEALDELVIRAQEFRVLTVAGQVTVFDRARTSRS